MHSRDGTRRSDGSSERDGPQTLRSELPPLSGTTKHNISLRSNPLAAAPAFPDAVSAVPVAKRAANQLVKGLSARDNLSPGGTVTSLRDEKEPVASWCKLPLKTASKSLAFACGLSSRGGFQ